MDAVYAVRRRTTRSVAALLLLDVSRSTGEQITGAEGKGVPRRVLDGEIESVRYLAAALDRLGDRFAVYAFNSQGRQAVRCFQLKAFAEPIHCLPSRLAALAPTANTRLGAAIRHATQLLLREAARSRLLLVVTDGLPQDSDYGDVTYAVADTAHALAEAQAVGIKPLGVALEAGQDEALLDMLFGRGRYARIREAARLPEALPRLYRRWAR
jgi:nitric oxide reductase activation protein